jgi:ElaB/YqjD/DUF883 family membrane-anchored ribosome-binding protein
MFEEKEITHPSFAQLSFNRVSCHGGEALYGSELQQNTVIEMNLYTSRTRRGLGRDWYYADKKIVSVTMSQNQFSELITSMNMGDGIPVTLNFTREDGVIESPEFESMLEEHEREVTEHTETISEDAVELLSIMQELLKGSGTVKKNDREVMLKKAEKVVREIKANLPHVEQCFKENMDKVVTEAKGTIEAFYQHRVIEAGLEALPNGGNAESPKLIENEE